MPYIGGLVFDSIQDRPEPLQDGHVYNPLVGVGFGVMASPFCNTWFLNRISGRRDAAL